MAKKLESKQGRYGGYISFVKMLNNGRAPDGVIKRAKEGLTLVGVSNSGGIRTRERASLEAYTKPGAQKYEKLTGSRLGKIEEAEVEETIDEELIPAKLYSEMVESGVRPIDALALSSAFLYANISVRNAFANITRQEESELLKRSYQELKGFFSNLDSRFKKSKGAEVVKVAAELFSRSEPILLAHNGAIEQETSSKQVVKNKKKRSNKVAPLRWPSGGNIAGRIVFGENWKKARENGVSVTEVNIVPNSERSPDELGGKHEGAKTEAKQEVRGISERGTRLAGIAQHYLKGWKTLSANKSEEHKVKEVGAEMLSKLERQFLNDFASGIVSQKYLQTIKAHLSASEEANIKREIAQESRVTTDLTPEEEDGNSQGKVGDFLENGQEKPANDYEKIVSQTAMLHEVMQSVANELRLQVGDKMEAYNAGISKFGLMFNPRAERILLDAEEVKSIANTLLLLGGVKVHFAKRKSPINRSRIELPLDDNQDLNLENSKGDSARFGYGITKISYESEIGTKGNATSYGLGAVIAKLEVATLFLLQQMKESGVKDEAVINSIHSQLIFLSKLEQDRNKIISSCVSTLVSGYGWAADLFNIGFQNSELKGPVRNLPSQGSFRPKALDRVLQPRTSRDGEEVRNTLMSAMWKEREDLLSVRVEFDNPSNKDSDITGPDVGGFKSGFSIGNAIGVAQKEQQVREVLSSEMNLKPSVLHALRYIRQGQAKTSSKAGCLGKYTDFCRALYNSSTEVAVSSLNSAMMGLEALAEEFKPSEVDGYVLQGDMGNITFVPRTRKGEESLAGEGGEGIVNMGRYIFRRVSQLGERLKVLEAFKLSMYVAMEMQTAMSPQSLDLFSGEMGDMGKKIRHAEKKAMLALQGVSYAISKYTNLARSVGGNFSSSDSKEEEYGSLFVKRGGEQEFEIFSHDSYAAPTSNQFDLTHARHFTDSLISTYMENLVMAHKNNPNRSKAKPIHVSPYFKNTVEELKKASTKKGNVWKKINEMGAKYQGKVLEKQFKEAKVLEAEMVRALQKIASDYRVVTKQQKRLEDSLLKGHRKNAEEAINERQRKEVLISKNVLQVSKGLDKLRRLVGEMKNRAALQEKQGLKTVRAMQVVSKGFDEVCNTAKRVLGAEGLGQKIKNYFQEMNPSLIEDRAKQEEAELRVRDVVNGITRIESWLLQDGQIAGVGGQQVAGQLARERIKEKRKNAILQAVSGNKALEVRVMGNQVIPVVPKNMPENFAFEWSPVERQDSTVFKDIIGKLEQEVAAEEYSRINQRTAEISSLQGKAQASKSPNKYREDSGRTGYIEKLPVIEQALGEGEAGATDGGVKNVGAVGSSVIFASIHNKKTDNKFYNRWSAERRADLYTIPEEEEANGEESSTTSSSKRKKESFSRTSGTITNKGQFRGL